MNPIQRTRKRISVVIIVTLFLGAVGTLLYFALRPEPTCFDGKHNQGEEQTDCGGPCDPCEVIYEAPPEEFVIRESAILPGSEPDTYDVLARVQNPNDELGASSLSYTFTLRGENEESLVSAREVGFILPQETKTFLFVGLRTEEVPVSVTVSFSDFEWQKFDGYQAKPPMSVINKRYDELSAGPFFSEAVGTFVNDSSFDYKSVFLKVILRDASGTPIAFNQTEMNTVLSGEYRDFILRFPDAFPGDVVTMDVEPDVDFFRDENFVERYRPRERFQEFR